MAVTEETMKKYRSLRTQYGKCLNGHLTSKESGDSASDKTPNMEVLSAVGIHEAVCHNTQRKGQHGMLIIYLIINI